MSKMSAPMLTGGKMSAPAYMDDSTPMSPTRRFRDLWDLYNQFGPSTPEGGNPNPLLFILPRLYEGDYTVGEALGILFSGSPLDLSEEALESARSVYFEPSKQQLAAVSEVLGIDPRQVKDQLQQHNATSDPLRAFTEGNKYATEESAKETLWETQILPALESGGDFIKTAIFGPAPSGGPKSTTTMFEEWMERSLNDLKGPITLTVDPEEGLLLEIMIPVNFEINGEPLKIQIFDEDGNLVGVEEIGEAVWNAAEGTWGKIVDGVFEPILDIFDPDDTDSRTAVERIFDAAESVLATTGRSGVEQGGWLGEVLGEEVRRQLGFNEETNTIEGTEEGTLDPDSDLMGEDPAGTAGQEPVDADGDGIDDNTGLPIVEEPEEDEPPAKTVTPRGTTVVDKDNNIIGISGDDGNFYVQDEQGNWVVQPEGEDVGGEAELPADTTIEQDAPVKKEVEIADVDPLGQGTAEEEDVPEKDGGLGPSPDTTPEYSQEEDFDQDGILNYLDADADNDGVPDIIDGDPFDPKVGETFGPDDGKADDDIVKKEVEIKEADPLPPPQQEDTKVQQPAGRVITDKDNNIVGISGDDGNFYVQDAQGNWVVSTTGLGDGGETEVPANTLIEGTGDENNDKEQPPVVLIPRKEDPQPTDDGQDRRDGVDGQDGIDGIDGIDGQDGAPGAPGATGARGLPGASAPRPGFMGGLSYQLPGFVGVQYQPKDYMVELNRIIGESLFEGMI